MRRAFRLLLAFLLVGLATAVMLELAVRALRLAPPIAEAYGSNVKDPYIPYKHAPRSVLRGRWHTDEFDYELSHNSLGFRDNERQEEKPAGTFRILALGDSFTYGIGADFDATWPSVLERALNERSGPHPRVEVIRMGLPRYFPAAERLVLEHYGLRFQPDLVVVGILPNDVIDTHYGLDAIQIDSRGFMVTRQAQRLGDLARWLYVHSEAMRIVLGRIVAALDQRRDPVRWDDVYRDRGFHENDWVQMESDLEGILALARKGGAELVLVSIPQAGPWDESSRYPDQRLAAWSAQHGAHSIATLPALDRAATDGPLYWPKDGHCTPRGYEVIGSAVAAAFVERGLVP